MSPKRDTSRRLRCAALSLSCVLAASTTFAVTSASDTVGTFSAGDAFPLARNLPQLSRIVFELGTCGPMLRSHWHDPSGMIIAAEELETGDDGFVRYRYWRPNIDESAVVTRSGPKTLSIELDQAGHKERREVEVPDNVAAGPMMTLIAQNALVRLKDGDTVPMRYVVPDKFAAYTFNLVKARPSEASRFGVSMTPDSWTARQFARQVTMYFDANGDFDGMKGPALPALGTAQHRQALDLDVMVNRHYTRPCSPEPVSNPRQLAD